MKIGFYILGKKGYVALDAFREAFGVSSIAFVVGASDSGVENDWYSEIADLCFTYGVEFRTRGEQSDKLQPVSDFNFAIGWKWIIADSSRLVVFHDSLLPKYRGFAPLVNMLVNGANEIGVTALVASDEYDKGEIIYQSRKNISYPIKILEAIDEIIPIYTELVIRIAKDIFSTGKLNSIPQDEDLASYSLWRDERDYFIDWTSDAEEIRRFVDAVGTPYRGAAAFLNGQIVRIVDVEPVKDVYVENRKACLGKTIFIQNHCPVVVCGAGLLKLADIRSEDGKTLIGRIQFRSRFENKK
jgi:methionyl-tRNA formyltransferase